MLGIVVQGALRDGCEAAVFGRKIQEPRWDDSCEFTCI